MYGLTRATVTLLAAAVAGFLIWIATQISEESNGGYWSVYGLLAGAGLVMALSQLLGGWTKWGWPRLSINVFLWAFVPVAVVVLWVLIFHQPHGNWFRDHVRDWSDDISIDGLVKDFTEYVGVLAFGLGLVFGYTFDTTGPVARRVSDDVAPAEPIDADEPAAVSGRTAPPPRDEPDDVASAEPADVDEPAAVSRRTAPPPRDPEEGPPA